MTSGPIPERILIIGDESSIERMGIQPSESRHVEIAASLIEAAEKQSTGEYSRVIIDHSMLKPKTVDILDEPEFDSQEILVELLSLANQPQGLDALLERLVDFLVKHAKCECIAIRLRDGQDFPYYEQHGFSQEFIELENSLCALNPEGRLLLDENGNVVLECMCGHVLCGRCEPSKEYFTARGSFWTNSTSALVDAVTEDDRYLQNLRGRCVERFESVALVPMRSESRTYGMIHLTDKRKDRFAPDVISLIEDIGNIAANVIARKQAEDALYDSNRRLQLLSEEQTRLYVREHKIAEILQQALVPPDVLKEIYGYRFAVRYRPALKEAEVGGDFYDIFDLGDGKIGVLVGDVVGKGLPAAIRVAAARYTIRGYAYLDPRPARVMTRANNVLCRDQLPETGMLTAFFAVIDARLGAILYSNAGHEPPLLLDESGIREELTLSALPLGVQEETEYPEGSRRLDRGGRVVMFTDGITEARKPGPELFGIGRVRECLTRNLGSSIEDLADCLLNTATEHADGRLQDDAAIVIFEQISNP